MTTSDRTPSSIPARRTAIRLALVGLAALVAAVVVLAVHPGSIGQWARGVTGEEDAWEALKGVGALTLLEVTGEDLELAPDAPMDHVSMVPYGVNTFLQLEPDPGVVRRSLATMRDAGVVWARQHFPWEDIEIHGPGDFEDRRNEPARSAWDKYDRLVSLADDYGIRLLVRLDDPPSWAYDDPDAEGPQKGPPSDLQDWSNFVTAVVDRYCGHVRYYQLWNEPNIYPEWGERDVDPAGYVELLRVGAQAARAACDDVVIVSAALAQTTEPGGRNMDDLVYLDRLYDEGWTPHFDVLAVQAFGLWTGPTDRRVSRDRTNFGRLLLTRDLMVRRGDENKPIWITEFGWNSVPPDRPAPYGRVSEEVRARYTLEAYDRIVREWPFVGVAFAWFFRRPNFEWHERPEGWFRLVDPDWNETPAWDSMRELGLAPPVLYDGLHDVTAPAIRYTGPWQAADVVPAPVDAARGENATERITEGDIRIGSVGAEVDIRFRGTGYEARLAPHLLPPAADIAQSEPDPGGDGRSTGLPPGAGITSPPGSDAVASEAGDVEGTEEQADPVVARLFTVLDGEVREVSIAEGDQTFGAAELADDYHTLIVRVDEGKLALDAVRVTGASRPSPMAPWWRALAAALLVSILGGVWVVRAARRGSADDRGARAAHGTEPADGDPAASGTGSTDGSRGGDVEATGDHPADRSEQPMDDDDHRA